MHVVLFHLERYNACASRANVGALLVQIARRRRAHQEKHPDAKVISLGIGDTTEPIPKSIAEAMQAAAAGMGTLEGYSGRVLACKVVLVNSWTVSRESFSPRSTIFQQGLHAPLLAGMHSKAELKRGKTHSALPFTRLVATLWRRQPPALWRAAHRASALSSARPCCAYQRAARFAGLTGKQGPALRSATPSDQAGRVDAGLPARRRQVRRGAGARRAAGGAVRALLRGGRPQAGRGVRVGRL